MLEARDFILFFKYPFEIEVGSAKLQSNKFHSYYRPPSLVRTIKSNRLRYKTHLPIIDKVGDITTFLFIKLYERGFYEDLSICEKIILEWILNK